MSSVPPDEDSLDELIREFASPTSDESATANAPCTSSSSGYQREPQVAASSRTLPSHWPPEIDGILSQQHTGNRSTSAALEIKNLNKDIRLRYNYEVKKEKRKVTSDFAVLKVSGVPGDAFVIVEVLTGRQKRENINILYLGIESPEWKSNDGSILYRRLTLKESDEIRVPCIGVIRIPEKDIPNPDGQKIKASELYFKFHVIQGDIHMEAESPLIRCKHLASDNGQLTIIHVNPNEGREPEMEITILCSNMKQNCKVLFINEEKKYRQEGRITLTHKQNSAVVVMVPKISIKGITQVKLWNPKTNEYSESEWTFTFLPCFESDTSRAANPRSSEMMTYEQYQNLFLAPDSSNKGEQGVPPNDEPKKVINPPEISFIKIYTKDLQKILKEIPNDDILKLAQHLNLRDQQTLGKASNGILLHFLRLCLKSQISKETFMSALTQFGHIKEVEIINDLSS